MKRMIILASVLAVAFSFLLLGQQPQAKGKQAPFQLTAEQKSQVQAKLGTLSAMVRSLKAKRADESLLADVEVYEKSGQFLLEFPETFVNQDGVTQLLTVLDQGIERATQLQKGQSPWVAQKGRKALGYYSALDGSVQPMGLTIPDSYDGTKPVRLYVWLHGRDANLGEASFLWRFSRPATANATYDRADLGQIILDAYGRWNNANHWAGEGDIFEGIAAVQRRYKIDPDRIILRGFSLGGAGAWHVAAHHPDAFAAAEIGAGTWPRRSTIAATAGGYPPYQQAPLNIWENITDWALNFYNLPLAAHDGDSDTQVASIPPPDRGVPTRGQLESSIRVREQLAREGYPSEGEPNFMRAQGTPDIFLISGNTGHNVSPLVRSQLEAFLKEWGDKGRTDPDHIRFLTYTTRYNRSHWISIDGMEKHYQRAEVDAQRDADHRTYNIATKNVSRLVLREMNYAGSLRVDGQNPFANSQLVKKTGGPQITLEKVGASWRVETAKPAAPQKTHALQGPVDDAFLDPFLLVRPTGTPWNKEANEQALRILARFDRVYARWYRAHPRIKDDKDVTESDFAKYNVALFGDPGSNQWIAKLNGRLPMTWTKESITLADRVFPSAGHVPVMVYPNPLNTSRYVVLNSGLTIDEKEYQADYSMPKLGDFAVLKVTPGSDVPDAAVAGLFDEFWQIPKELK